MESKINRLKTLIESKKEKYPNVSKLWLSYINQKCKSFDNAIDNAVNIFENIEDNVSEDLSMNSIIALFLLYHNKL
tara:strand:- start:1149 stop:1376 length:228 start_codon:yes stop_codon:yes gene_type:complete